MNSSCPEEDRHVDERIDALINEYFDRRHAGEELTPESFAADHPEMGEQLLPYLDGLAFLERIHPVGSNGTKLEEPGAVSVGLPVITGYKLLEELGRGGMGVVYKAVQISTKRVVALKVISSGPFASPTALRRFDREVELTARFQHPGIIRVLESGNAAGQRYYATDYVPGVRMDKYLTESHPDVRVILGIVQRICEAVDYAHRRNVIHRDLKPANILIDDEGSPHILDFGLAKATDQGDTQEVATAGISLPGQVLGTLFYLSPEQAAGRVDEIDARTDVYALGVVLFEALTGSLPLDTTGRPSEIIQRILETPSKRPSSVTDRVNDEVETIVLKALEKDRSRRYQSAKEMADDIHRYLRGEPVLAKRPSSFYVIRRKWIKHRRRIGYSAVMVAGLCLFSAFAQSWSRKQELRKARDAALRIQQDLEYGLVDQALGQAVGLCQRYPELPEARLVWAQAEYRSRDQGPGAAITELESWIRYDSSDWASAALLVEMYTAGGDLRRAEALQTDAERKAPDTADAWYVRSFAVLDAQRALQCAEQAVKRDASHVPAWSRLAHLRQRSGDPYGACQAADTLIAMTADVYSWTVFKGRVLATESRFEEAVEQFTQVHAYLDRAHVYRRLGRYEEAVADYTRELAEREARGLPPQTWILFQRATPLWILGRRDEALEDYRRFRELLNRPSYADARRFVILLELGRAEEGKEILRAALRDVEEDWLRQILRCLGGQITPQALVDDALARNNIEQLCEAYYYAGETCLLAASPAADQARSWFQKCVETGLGFDPNTQLGTPMNEHELAIWRLGLLGPVSPASQSEKE